MAAPDTYRPWRTAWHDALYSRGGFYRSARPRDHFRTSVTTDVDTIAAAVVELAARHGLGSVTDVGAGDGRLLAAVARLASDLTLHGVDLRARPDDLPERAGWSTELPPRLAGLVLCHELLDNVPCDVVEVDADRQVRSVEVDDSGAERLGEPVRDDDAVWLHRWWPIEQPGERAEVGLTRDRWWHDLTSRTSGIAVAVDYGHLRETRPIGGGLTAFQHGAQVEPSPWPDRDLTAPVALDSLASVAGGTLLTQREVLADLVPEPATPQHPETDPRAYVEALARRTRRATLTARDGLGGYSWLITPCPGPAAAAS